MSAVQKFQRVDRVTAVQYIPGDVEAEQAIRGWTGLPIDTPINLEPEVWLVRRDEDGTLFLVLDSDLREQFIKVVETTGA